MKRNFLILMLMALLPLAGWAQIDISGVTPTINADNFYYTNSTPTVTMTVKSPSTGNDLTVATDYTLRYYNDQETEINKSNVKAVGTYYVAAVGTGDYEGTTAKVQFNIVKMPLLLTGTAGTKVYGTDADGDIFTLAETASVKTKYNSPSSQLDLTSALKDKITFTRKSGTSKNDYEIYGTINDATYAGNYSIASADITTNGTAQAKYSITAKTFDATNISVDDITAVTYNNSAQEPAVTVKDIALGTTLVKGTDYTVTYTNNTDAALSTADTHPYATVTGKGNYSNGTIAVAFTIKEATVLVTPTAKKVYDGTATVTDLPANVSAMSDNAKFDFQGFLNNETVTWDTTNTTWAVPAEEASANVKDSYTLQITANNFTATNYKFVVVDGTFTITQLPITFTADNATVTYGETETYALTDEWKSTAIDSDEATLAKIIKITRAETAEASGTNAGKYKLTPAFMTDDEIDALVDADESIAADNKATYKANYKATRDNYKPTFAPGYATLEKADMQIALNQNKFTLTKVYDGQDIDLGDITADKLRFIGASADEVNIDNLVVTIAAQTATNTTKKNVDTYTITLSGAVADNYNITYIPSTYSITVRPIQLTIAKQTFRNNTVPTVAQNYTIETILDADGNPVAEQGIASTDTNVFKLGLDNTKVSQNTTEGDDYGKITQAVTTNDISTGIIAVDAATTAANSVFANYQFSYTDGSGAVQIIAESTTTLSDKEDLSALSASASAENIVIDSNRQLKKNVWASLVLPFDITVRNLSNALGYAVVDMFVEDEGDVMNFKIFMGEIPAYTPFLVKVDEDINLNTVTFNGTIVAPTAATNARLTQSNNSYNFIGNMKYENVTTGDFWSDGSSMSEDGIQWNKFDGSASKMRALKAYITAKEGVSGAPVIYIEEPDGSTTAINGVFTEKVSTVKEGWYTLNGVKLNGVPTQKGIYINNGKKIVIK